MTTCPNCGRKLHLKDWRPECPGCGTNLNYYNSNKNLLEESEKAEAEHARFQPRIDRAKAAYAGSKFAIIRIVLSLLPIGALFLPLCKNAAGESANVLKLYNIINEAGIGNVLGGAFSSLYNLSVCLLLLSAVMIIVSLVLIIMSLGKHGKIRVLITYALMVALSCASVITFVIAQKKAPVPFFESPNGASVGIGAILYVLLMLVLLLWNVFLLKKGIPVKYTQCLVGGIPSDEYYRLKAEGISTEELYRKMLAALTELEFEKGIDDEEGDEAQ